MLQKAGNIHKAQTSVKLVPYECLQLVFFAHFHAVIAISSNWVYLRLLDVSSTLRWIWTGPKAILRQNMSDHAICHLWLPFPLNNSKILEKGLIILCKKEFRYALRARRSPHNNAKLILQAFVLLADIVLLAIPNYFYIKATLTLNTFWLEIKLMGNAPL